MAESGEDLQRSAITRYVKPEKGESFVCSRSGINCSTEYNWPLPLDRLSRRHRIDIHFEGKEVACFNEFNRSTSIESSIRSIEELACDRFVSGKQLHQR